ncbi:MAG: hypothetical protein ACOYNO_05205 [Saprospiraceae bacterium]
MSNHGNSKKNSNPQHLYAIYDKKENEVFKYGISDKPIDEDGLSNRIREQVTFLNHINGWLRFFAKILLFDIPGKAKASEIETEYIDAFFDEHGRYPTGNRRRRS